MKRMMMLIAIMTLSWLGASAASAQTHQIMPAGPYHDLVNVGDQDTELTHNPQGWGAIQPLWSGGGYGGFGGTGETCRATWHVFQTYDSGSGTCAYTGDYAAPAGYPCPDLGWGETGTPDIYGNGQPWASLDLNFGPPGGTKTLYYRYLDGGGSGTVDDLNVYVGTAFVDSVDALGTPENWIVNAIDVSAYSGIQTVKFECTGPNASWINQWGQACIDQVGVTIQNTDPEIAPVAANTDPINCSASKTVTFHYTPGTAGEVRGYSVRVQCTGALTFHATDVTFYTVPAGASILTNFITNVPGSDYTVDYAVTGQHPVANGITAAADLFRIVFHGNATGTGEVSIAAVTLRSWDNQPITPVIHAGIASIPVDCTAPTGSFTINNGATYTTSPSVTLDSSVSGADQMRFQNVGGAWSTWENYAASRSWTLEGADGTKTVNAEFRDLAGNTVASSDDIILDTAGPVVTSFAINGGAAYTASPNVTLNSSVAGADQMRFQNAGGTWSDWESYADSRLLWALEGADGTKTVNAEFRDLAGHTVTGSDNIILDTAAPVVTSFAINGGAVYTTSPNVTLNSSVAGADQMRFQNDSGTWSDWESYADSRLLWALEGADGTKTVNAEFRDLAGHTVTGSDNIILDTAGPVVTSFAINGGAAYTASPNVTLNSSVAGADQMRFQNAGGTWSDWESYADSRLLWALEGADGTKTVNAEFRDLAGHTVTGSDNIILDTAGPVFTSFLINGGAVYTTSPNVTLNSSVAGADQMRFQNDSGTWSDWESYADSRLLWALEGADGTKTVNAEFRDLAGHTVVGSDNIILDRVAPPGVTGLTSTRGHHKVTLNWTMAVATDVDHYEVWRAVWHTGDNVTSAYPEYDDVNPTQPVWPANHAAALASAEWVLVNGTVPGAAVSYIDNYAPRGIYYYEVYAVDAAGTIGPGAGPLNRATNYLLGDVVGDNGDIQPVDITFLGAHYGTAEADLYYNNECDVGRTDDWSGDGIPLTDSMINFEDLMIFALNYDITLTKSPPLVGTPDARLAWVRIDASTWALHLLEPCLNLKGLRLQAELPEGAVTAVTAGGLLAQQAGPWFLQNIPAHGLDAGLAALGCGVVVTGQGELVRVHLDGEYDLSHVTVEARGLDNRPCAFTFEASTAAPELPAVHALSANYPNPFNPSTKIDFALPADEHVRLTVYAVDGRRIATLVDESLAAGNHTVTWTGRDEHGQTVPSGMYFYRIQAGGYCSTQKMTLLK